jgi:hypothetical protein
MLVVLAGAMLTPTVVWAARQPVIRRGAAVAARAGIRWAFWQAIRRLLFLLPLVTLVMFSAQEVAAQSATHEARLPLATADGMSARTVDELMARIKSSKKPLPAWALDLAMRAYVVYKTYHNGKRVGVVEKRADEIEREVSSILKVVAGIQAQVEAGQEMTDREYRLTRDLLDVHGHRLDDLTGRVAHLEQTAAEQAVQLAASEALVGELRRQLEDARNALTGLERSFRRPDCGTGRAWRNGICVDVAANPH